MNIKKNFLTAFALGAIILAFSTADAFGQTEPPSRSSQFSLYGVHFISAGQTMRVSVGNPRFSDSVIVPCIRVRIVFDIYEQSPAEPVRLRFARRVSREIELEAGEAATFDYASGRAGDWVSPAVFASPEETESPATLHFTSALVIREFGRSILNLPAVEKGFDPQPDPPSAIKQ